MKNIMTSSAPTDRAEEALTVQLDNWARAHRHLSAPEMIGILARVFYARLRRLSVLLAAEEALRPSPVLAPRRPTVIWFTSLPRRARQRLSVRR